MACGNSDCSLVLGSRLPRKRAEYPMGKCSVPLGGNSNSKTLILKDSIKVFQGEVHAMPTHINAAI